MEPGATGGLVLRLGSRDIERWRETQGQRPGGANGQLPLTEGLGVPGVSTAGVQGHQGHMEQSWWAGVCPLQCP